LGPVSDVEVRGTVKGEHLIAWKRATRIGCGVAGAVVAAATLGLRALMIGNDYAKHPGTVWVFLAVAIACGAAYGLSRASSRTATREALLKERHYRRRERAWVGHDGVALESGEFVGYDAVTEVARVRDLLVLETPSRAERQLLLSFDGNEAIRAEALVAESRTGARSAADGSIHRLLARADGEAESAWRSRIASLLEPSGYRGAPVSAEDLVQIVCDPAADPSVRLGASLLLRTLRRVTTVERDALRGVLAQTAHPRVRVALEELDEEGDEERPASRAASSEE
jgi:hypothetical protein